MLTKLSDAELFATVAPYTMITRDRLQALADLVRGVDLAGVTGDLIECGVANGGSAAVIAHAAETPRRLWLLDSFEGMPVAGAEDGMDARAGDCAGSEENVRHVLAEVSTVCDVRIVRGWFRDTLRQVTSPEVALLHVDCDWYDSVRICLRAFYDRVVPGGIVVIDDYGHWPGCRRAVDEFLAERKLNIVLEAVGYTARWFAKPC